MLRVYNTVKRNFYRGDYSAVRDHLSSVTCQKRLLLIFKKAGICL